MNLPSTQSRQRQSGQTVQDAASNAIGDLQGFEDGMGATRNPRQSDPDNGWIVPTMEDGAPYQSGDVKIREAGTIGGFRDDQGRRLEIRVKRDGQWVSPTSDDEASAIISAMKRRGSDTQQSAGGQTDNFDVGPTRQTDQQTQNNSNAEVQWDAQKEQRFEHVMRRMRDLGNRGTFSRTRTTRAWQQENGYEPDGRLTEAQYNEVMRQYNEGRR